jgi:hypothetical protein
MANLGENDPTQTEPIDYELPDPNPHGQVHVSSGHSNPKALAAQMKQHLAERVQHLNATKAYHGGQIPYAPGGAGQSSQGGFTGWGMSGGASGSADYFTTDVGGTADADSGGPNSD